MNKLIPSTAQLKNRKQYLRRQQSEGIPIQNVAEMVAWADKRMCCDPATFYNDRSPVDFLDFDDEFRWSLLSKKVN